jgi:hypothetical protein
MANEKALQTYSIGLPKLAMKKLDNRVLRNNILKTRGFLMRKSMKYERKWTYCFFYIDINAFVKKGDKILRSYKPIHKVMDREFTEIAQLKRLKLNEQTHILVFPYPAGLSPNQKTDSSKLLCIKYSLEERVLNEVLDTFRDA